MADRFMFVKCIKGQYTFCMEETEAAKYKERNFEELKTLILENIVSSYQEMKLKNDWDGSGREPDFSDSLVIQMKQNRLFDALPVNRELKEGLGKNRGYGYLDIKIDIPLSGGRYFAFECKRLDDKTGKSSLQ